MSESVEIIIEAEDLATPVIAKSAKAVDGLDAGLKRIKESGGQAKKSADFARIIASSLGGSEIGSYIGQIGEAADKTAQFAEVQKVGGVGAFAFKAGLVGLVGTLSFGVGKAIGDQIFGTKKYADELKAAAERTKELDAAIAKSAANRFAENKEDIELIREPDQKKAAYTELLSTLKTDIGEVENAIRKGQKANDDFAKSWNYLGNDIALNDAAKAKVQADKERLAVMKDQRDELTKILSDRVAENELLKKQNEQQDKSEAYVETLRQQLAVLKATNDEKAGVIAGQQTVGGDTEEATRILKEIDAIAAKAEADKIAADELKRLETDKENNAKRLIALKENELNKLAEETILLNQGREAANAFALEKQGLAKEDALAIAREREQIDLQKDAIKEAEKQAGKQKPLEAAPVNVAVESRLLTRGGGDDPSKITAKNTADAVKELQQLRKEMLEERRNATKLKVVRA